jgi:arylsulfatase A-like enzyme
MKRWLSSTFCFAAMAAIMAGNEPAATRTRHNLSGAVAQRTASAQTAQQRRPNIVLIFPDNLGWGELGVYGSVRGVPTPRIDRLASEGMRLTNFNVEFSCTVSRAALLTGRYAVRTGAVQNSGITQWEITVAEALKSVGYATALFGKWHLGGLNWQQGRAPTNQGFDEWYGIPMTSNEAQTTTSPTFNPATMEAPSIWEGKAGEPSRKVKVFDLDTRRTLDREAAARGIAFMERSVKANTPFFLYYPITQIHFPTLAHPDFDGKTGAGDIGDSMADVDYNTGLILDTIQRLGIEQNTIVIWCADNGAEQRRPWRGSSGPWNGFYNTVMEGGIRTPCLIRWPGRIPAGRVSNEIVHQIDIFPTLAAAIGADIVPKDRAIDGVNQLPFLEGKQARSNRDTIIFITAGTQPRAVKWFDWKFHYAFQPEAGAPTVPPLMRLFNLRSDPKEESDIKDANPWAQSAMDKIVADFAATAVRYPHVPPNAPDPYTPPRQEGPRRVIGETITTASGLSYVFTKLGQGPRPQAGDLMVIHGIGRFTDGKEFWNTRTDDTPYEYTPGVDRVIRGFEEGMREVRAGDRIVITMKPELAYGEKGNRDIPPNATLVFDYEILAVKPLSIARLLREGMAGGTLDDALTRARSLPNLKDYYVSAAGILTLAGSANRRQPGDGEKVLSFGLILLPDAYQLHQALGRAQSQRGAVADAIRSYENALRHNTKKTDAARRDYETATQALAELQKR